MCAYVCVCAYVCCVRKFLLCPINMQIFNNHRTTRWTTTTNFKNSKKTMNTNSETTKKMKWILLTIRCQRSHSLTSKPRATLWNVNPGIPIVTTWSIAGQEKYAKIYKKGKSNIVKHKISAKTKEKQCKRFTFRWLYVVSFPTIISMKIYWSKNKTKT